MAGQRVSKSMVGVAAQDGKVTKIDQDTGMVEITYKDGTKEIFEFGHKFTPFAGFFADHELELVVKLGKQVKQNDIITYNKGYFKLDPDTKQLDMSLGVMANVAFMEMDLTLEDSTAISEEMSKKLAIRPVNIRTIVLNKNSVIYDYKKIGDEVEITTDLMVFDEEAIATDTMFNADEETIKMMSELNRKTPSAKHSGKIVKMNAYSTVPISEMHPSLQKVFRESIAWKNKQAKFAKDSLVENEYPGFQLMKEGSKYLGITFDKDIVVIIYYIQDEIVNSVADKNIVCDQLKFTTAGTLERDVETESKKKIDLIFSINSADRRICVSYMKTGLLNRICEQIENTALDLYFK